MTDASLANRQPPKLTVAPAAAAAVAMPSPMESISGAESERRRPVEYLDCSVVR
jgi:hypothetical protein